MTCLFRSLFYPKQNKTMKKKKIPWFRHIPHDPTCIGAQRVPLAQRRVATAANEQQQTKRVTNHSDDEDSAGMEYVQGILDSF